MARCRKVVIVKGRNIAKCTNNADSTSGSELEERWRYNARSGEGENPGHVVLDPFPTEEGEGEGPRNFCENIREIFRRKRKCTRAFLQYTTCLKLLVGCFGLGVYISSGLDVGKLGFYLWYSSGPKSTILVYGEYLYAILMEFFILGLLTQKTYGKRTKLMFRLWWMTTLLVLLATLFICPGLHLFNYSDPGRLINVRKCHSDPINWMLLAAWINLNQFLVLVLYLRSQDYVSRALGYSNFN